MRQVVIIGHVSQMVFVNNSYQPLSGFFFVAFF